MVLPVLIGLATRFAPRIIPFIGKAFKFIAAKPIKRFVVPSIVTGAALESPAIREALKKAPTAPIQLGKKFGTVLEAEITKERKPLVRKALEIGGIAGVTGAAAIIGARELRKRRRRKRKERRRELAALPLAETPLLPSVAKAAAIVPLPAGAAPLAEAPIGAVKEPIRRKRIKREVPSLQPVFINQIQISTE